MYVFSGIILRYIKKAPLQMVAAFYPVVYLFGAFYISFFIGATLFVALSSLGFPLLSLLGSLLIGYVALKILINLGNRLAVFWLLRIYLFSLEYANNKIPLLEERIEIFCDYLCEVIRESKKNEIDEILIVGHSVGTILLIPIVQKALKKVNIADFYRAKISILTLGECIPIVSFLPQATQYKEAMYALALHKNIDWLDYTSLIDGACFPLMDFYKESGVEAKTLKPLYLSPRFHTLFPKKAYKKLRRDKYLSHFLYLMATQKSGGYDFFRLTADNQYLVKEKSL